MPLRFDLGPFEVLHIGKSVIRNSHERACFVVEGETPILRSKDFLAAERALAVVEKLYRCVQQMYLEEAPGKYQGAYLALRVGAVEESPDRYPLVQEADELVRAREYYRALKLLKKLIKTQAFLVDRTPPEGYMPRTGGRKPAVGGTRAS